MVGATITAATLLASAGLVRADLDCRAGIVAPEAPSTNDFCLLPHDGDFWFIQRMIRRST
jgi:hypothetical protein